MICYDIFSLTNFVHITMSYYWFNKPELLQKAKNKYHTCGGKEKSAKYYLGSKDVIKKKQKISFKIFQKKKKKQKENMKEIGIKI